MSRFFGLIFFIIFAFQNCGKFYANDHRSIYSYSSAPDFYYDIKLQEVLIDSAQRESYKFDFAVSFSRNPNSPVSYQINYSTPKLNPSCPPTQGVATQATKHLQLSCLIPTSDDLYVEIIMVGPGGETVTDQFRF